MTFDIELLYYFIAIYPITFVSIIMHEIGHYIAARLLGYRPKYFIIGTKTRILNKFNSLINFEINNLKVSINPFGFAGLVDLDSYTKDANFFEIKMMCLGGPFMNFILFLISFVFVIYFYIFDDKFINLYLIMFVFCNLLMSA